MPGVEGQPERGAEPAQHARRIGADRLGVDDRRRRAGALRHAIEELGLPVEAEVLERHLLAPGRVARHHPLRRADQEGVVDRVHPVEPELRQHVVGHVLLVEDASGRDLAGGAGPGDGAPVLRLRGQHLGAHRMVLPARAR